MKMISRTHHHICLIAIAAVLAWLTTSCSTTSKLGENDVLYTGVKHLKYHEENVKLDNGVKNDIFTAINVRPNNPLYSPYYRTPFPTSMRTQLASRDGYISILRPSLFSSSV